MRFEERLIDEVRCHDILYDPSLPDYKNALAKDAVWKTISRRLGVPEAHARKKWKKLRAVYKRNENRLDLEMGCTSPVNDTKYEFLQQMRFLDSFSCTRKNLEEVREVSSPEIAGYPCEDPSPEYSSSPTSLPISPKRRKRDAGQKQFSNLLKNASQLAEACTSTSSTRQLFDALATRVENAGLTNDEAGMIELAVTECVINKVIEVKNMRL